MSLVGFGVVKVIVTSSGRGLHAIGLPPFRTAWGPGMGASSTCFFSGVFRAGYGSINKPATAGIPHEPHWAHISAAAGN
jgi:hypothetical protein